MKSKKKRRRYGNSEFSLLFSENKESTHYKIYGEVRLMKVTNVDKERGFT